MVKNKIILIGTSSIVKFHVTALRKARLNIIAVASSNTRSSSEKKFARENNIEKHYSNWKNMIDEEKYDGIVIATRIKSTREILEYAIKKNVPILVEKPISFSSKEIKKLSKKSHSNIIVGYNRRFYKTVKEVKKMCSKEKSPILAIMTAPEKLDLENFFGNTSHSIDILRYVFGELKLKQIEKIKKKNKQKTISALFTNNRRDIIHFIGNWGASDNFSLSIFKGTEKIELKPYEELSIYNGIKVIEPTNTKPIRKYVPKLVKEITLDSIDQKIKPGFYQQSKAFSLLIKNKKRDKESASLEDAYKNIQICEKLVGKYEVGMK